VSANTARDSAVNRISDEYVAALTSAAPSIAVYLGRPSDGLDDLSPDGLAHRNELALSAVRAMHDAPVETDADRVARDVLIERLQVQLDRYDAGDYHANLNVMDSPLQDMRMVFDLVPTETDADWESVAGRLEALPGSLAGYRQSLLAGVQRGRVAALRQVDKCAEQCDAYSGRTSGHGFFTGLVAGAGRDGALGERLAVAASGADQAYADLAEFLRRDLRDHAPIDDAVGEERYLLASRDFLGATIDPHETYRWGWDEFLSIEAELIAVAGRLGDGAPRDVADQLDADLRYQVTGTEALRQWMQDLSDAAVADLGRTHFEIPEPLRRLDCKIAPPGAGVGAYYTGPTDDFSRPGAMWWSVEQGRDVFNTWREVTTIYHEGVPGHHLQIGMATFQREWLNDFQRLLASTSGHAEGWALYAERLVRELGRLDDDGDLLGMLDAQLFRAARVIIDIGMHLELEIPAGTGFHEGERWTPALGLEFLLTRTITDPAFAADEIDRYLGWPGQAPSYKVGERIWLDGRDAARRRHGDAFDPRAFHTQALEAGGMGLDPLAALLATL
jgi:uncharacterized protein (DUF885 family)